MRNLYKALGLASPKVEEAELRASIERCPNAELARRARAVLLDPARRRHYDATLHQLQHIARLRANLGLASSPTWTRSVPAGEFDVQPDGNPSRFESLKSRLAVVGRAVQAAQAQKRQGMSFCGCMFWLAVLILIASAWDSCQKPSRGSATTSSASSSARARGERRSTTQPAFSESALVLPRTGQLWGKDTPLAPLKVTTRDATYAYYVKLVPVGGREAVAEYFIRPGERLDALAPLGSYELRYAAGQVWYGTTHLFGPDTACSRAESTFDFRELSDGYSGYTVELFLQVNGNLRTERLAPEDF